MQVIREMVNAPGCVTSVFQPGTNLKTCKLHSRGVGSLYCLLLPKRIKSGVIELQCDLRELYFSNLEAAVTKQNTQKQTDLRSNLSFERCPHGQLPLQKESILHKIVKYNST